MDETKETKQDVKTSAGEGGTTSQDKPQTYNQEQVNKAVSDALAKAGRTDKVFSKREAGLKAREDAIAEKERQREAAELEEAKKDPDKLAEYQARKSIADERAELERSKAEHEAEIIAAREAQKEITIWQVASAKNVDPERLKELSEELGLEGKERLERLADEMTAKTGTTIEPDSGITTGAKKDLKSLTADEKLNRGFAEASKKK